MVTVTDVRIFGEGADDEQVESVEPGPVLEAQVGPQVEDARALDSLATTAALPGPGTLKRCYPQLSCDYS